MTIDTDYVDPATATGYVRELPIRANYTLNRFLPDRQINDIEALVEQITRTNRAAKFRAYDAETPIGQRDSFQRSRILMPPLGQKTLLTEWERLQLERVRTGGDNSQVVIDNILSDVDVNSAAVDARMELARGDVLTDGKLTLSGENGLTLEADYGVPGTHLVTADTTWATASTEILADIRLWADLYTDDAGEPPAYMLCSRSAVGYMLGNEEFRAARYGNLSGAPGTISRADLGQVLDAHGLPQIVEYHARINVDGVSTAPIAADKVVFLPANPADLGYTAWGITAEALELAGGSNPMLQPTDMAGKVAVVEKGGDPVQRWTKVAAVGMPVINDPNKLLVADVVP